MYSKMKIFGILFWNFWIGLAYGQGAIPPNFATSTFNVTVQQWQPNEPMEIIYSESPTNNAGDISINFRHSGGIFTIETDYDGQPGINGMNFITKLEFDDQSAVEDRLYKEIYILFSVSGVEPGMPYFGVMEKINNTFKSEFNFEAVWNSPDARFQIKYNAPILQEGESYIAIYKMLIMTIGPPPNSPNLVCSDDSFPEKPPLEIIYNYQIAAFNNDMPWNNQEERDAARVWGVITSSLDIENEVQRTDNHGSAISINLLTENDNKLIFELQISHDDTFPGTHSGFNYQFEIYLRIPRYQGFVDPVYLDPVVESDTFLSSSDNAAYIGVTESLALFGGAEINFKVKLGTAQAPGEIKFARFSTTAVWPDLDNGKVTCLVQQLPPDGSFPEFVMLNPGGMAPQDFITDVICLTEKYGGIFDTTFTKIDSKTAVVKVSLAYDSNPTEPTRQMSNVKHVISVSGNPKTEIFSVINSTFPTFPQLSSGGVDNSVLYSVPKVLEVGDQYEAYLNFKISNPDKMKICVEEESSSQSSSSNKPLIQLVKSAFYSRYSSDKRLNGPRTAEMTGLKEMENLGCLRGCAQENDCNCYSVVKKNGAVSACYKLNGELVDGENLLACDGDSCETYCTR